MALAAWVGVWWQLSRLEPRILSRRMRIWAPKAATNSVVQSCLAPVRSVFLGRSVLLGAKVVRSFSLA